MVYLYDDDMRTKGELLTSKRISYPEFPGIYKPRGEYIKKEKILPPSKIKIKSKDAKRYIVLNIFERDKVCRLCKSQNKLSVHHIFRKKYYPDKTNDISNLVLLCSVCHGFIHNNKPNIFGRR